MSQTPKVSIVVPAYREAENLVSLTERIFAAVSQAGIDSELIIVDDDSRDGTDEIVAALARRFPVRLITRHGKRGLSGAVLRGFAEATGEWLVVLDADLQHPPERIPQMVAPLEDNRVDFVIASRYTVDGGIAKDWPIGRRLASQIATLLARPFGRVSDPMSGFFALRDKVLKRANRFDPVGYKIALELIVKCRCKSIKEVPIVFSSRIAGESKASFAEGIRFGRHLWRLYWFRFRWLMIAAMFMAALVVVWFIAR